MVTEIILSIILVEILFRITYYAINKKNYHVSLKLKWKDSYVVPHPFLSFSYKKNTTINKNQKLPYPIHTNKFFSFKEPLNVNSLGHFGDEFSSKKDKVRILCLGASTTANNISDGKKDYTYPKLLEEYLNKKLNKKVEVFNCGIGGWTSVDIFINFVLNLIQLKPDYVILYHGYNDLPLYLMNDFELDYQHGRKNLGEVIHKTKMVNMLPKIKFLHSYEFVKDKLFGTGNIRNDVLRLITKNKIDYTNKYKDFKTQRDIIEQLIILCYVNKIKPIVSTFCYYDHERNLESSRVKEGVEIENRDIKYIAKKLDCWFVDQDKLIDKKDENFVDSIHFTPIGMKKLAQNFGDTILEIKE